MPGVSEGPFVSNKSVATSHVPRQPSTLKAGRQPWELVQNGQLRPAKCDAVFSLSLRPRQHPLCAGGRKPKVASTRSDPDVLTGNTHWTAALLNMFPSLRHVRQTQSCSRPGGALGSPLEPNAGNLAVAAAQWQGGRPAAYRTITVQCLSVPAGTGCPHRQSDKQGRGSAQLARP